MSDFLPTAPWPTLQFRAQVLKRLRAFFDERGFVEVETPLLSHDTVIDQHLDPLPVTLFSDPRAPSAGPTMYLQTSPEFGMKRLLAGGEAKAIYQITRAFRGAEAGDQHNPEFTMLEWYRVGDDYAAGMELLAELAKEMFGASDVERVRHREAFQRYAGFDPAGQNALKMEISSGGTVDVDIDIWMIQKVQPNLGLTSPAILYDYPAAEAALAVVRHDADGYFAERFELFYRGVELANGYHELLDPEVLAQRNARVNDLRESDGKPRLPEESRLLEAMQHGLPPCSGCALGVDRLVMLLAGASSIQEVIAFPIDRA